MNGKAELGPDQMGDVANPRSIRGGRALRQVEIAAQDRLAVLWGERGVVLADVGLNQAQFHTELHGARRRRKPERAEHGDGRQRKRRDDGGREVEPALAYPP